MQLLDILCGTQPRAQLMTHLFERPGERFTQADAARRSDVAQATVSRLLGELAACGLLLVEKHGPMAIYQLNTALPEVAALVRVTHLSGSLRRNLQTVLASSSIAISYACIYGSYARGEDRLDSDVDVLVLSDVDISHDVEAVGALLGAGAELNRRISLECMSVAQFDAALGNNSQFAWSVIQSPRIDLSGKPCWTLPGSRPQGASSDLGDIASLFRPSGHG